MVIFILYKINWFYVGTTVGFDREMYLTNACVNNAKYNAF